MLAAAARPEVQTARTDTDAALVERARRRENRAFDQLFDRHYPRVYALARKLEPNADAALDITQAAFVRAYRSLGSLQDGEAFLAWMFRIVVNLARDRARTARRKPWVSLRSLIGRGGSSESMGEPALFADASLDPARRVQGMHRNAAVQAAVSALPSEFREVVVLHHLERMGIREIAATLGVPEGTVKSRLGRARARLRSALGAWLDEGGEES